MIRITRGEAHRGKLIAYKIFINGAYRGKIKQNETKEFEVENGSHTVCVKINQVGSPTLRVHIDNSIVDLEVGSAVTGWKNIMWPYSHLFIGRDAYLFLRGKGNNEGNMIEETFPMQLMDESF